ncbi:MULTISPECIES: LacI family DNA-binding transcriptional regulator [unclassified Paenibacillus]|uniref:LacI family DNA-binding transcriptional regulator n=1 Tax=Paenibacillus TaxID=44249 RepID=UPI000BA6C051|nr:LacI family DNA-binding transcriptional regulator [Paenibacillus sp. 7541]PAK55977.1 hypothetical protein CHH75_01585 [Paenibacillus sp. 7541]
MARKVSIQVLADELGLSKYAVSRALSGKSGVSEATRQRVIELAKSLGYQKASFSQPSETGRESDAPSPFILICMRHIHSGNHSYWQRVLNGMLMSCDQQGLPYVIVSPELEAAKLTGEPESPQHMLAPHLDWTRCGGIVVMGTFPHSILGLVARAERPYVLVDHVDPLISCDKINNDNIEAGSIITRHLLSLHCTHLGFITDKAWSASFADRLAGARSAMDSPHGTEARLTEWRIPYGEPGWENALYQQFVHTEPDKRPDAWIGANDDIAIRWMRKLQAEGISIPESARIAGIDNVEASTLVSPQLTTVNLCKEELGGRAIEALLRRIERPGAPMESIHLSTRLIPRAST